MADGADTAGKGDTPGANGRNGGSQTATAGELYFYIFLRVVKW